MLHTTGPLSLGMRCIAISTLFILQWRVSLFNRASTYFCPLSATSGSWSFTDSASLHMTPDLRHLGETEGAEDLRTNQIARWRSTGMPELQPLVPPATQQVHLFKNSKLARHFCSKRRRAKFRHWPKKTTTTNNKYKTKNNNNKTVFSVLL